MKGAAGRTVLVTGAARRLGRAIALDLAAAGWQVAVHYRGSEDEARQTAGECNVHAPSDVFHAELADEAEVRSLVPAVVQRFGRIDAVVNNASRFEHDDARSFTAAGLAAHVASNTAAPVLLAQALAAHLEQRDATGAVVNLLDQKLWNPNPDFLSYTLSKAALEAATTLLAQGLAPRVRVVGVAPGLTLTSHLLPQEKFEELHKLSPLGRSSTPEDVAHAVRFALENGSVTGTTLLVDGGQHLMKFDRDFSMMS
ncbi:SDR family oxidoreductase [Ramlibacter sp. USB13]|uniref:SDR family oxidoreductase n=1 Tax=Ramlibacter cellulosilyticus TaxID=2764187 RepID=A0A923SCA5_9BURK|nr:SDR family oxidoreductase [Ramlibacter cellulosilyticus]MBC5784689.1 SDR family oxidoreductase [Ramlibacter cellulosilyticus]